MAGRISGRVLLPVRIAALLASAGAARAEVSIERTPAVIERRTFDPAHRPADMPPLSGREAAVTRSRFDCSARISYRSLEHRTEDGHCTARLQVSGIHMRLELRVTVWLPAGAPPRLADHEEGHREIDERMYERAVAAARELAGAADGGTLTAEGDDCETAEDRATRSAADRLCRDWLHRVAERAARINGAYDDLTRHGTRATPTAREAVESALESDADTGAANARQ